LHRKCPLMTQSGHSACRAGPPSELGKSKIVLVINARRAYRRRHEAAAPIVSERQKARAPKTGQRRPIRGRIRQAESTSPSHIHVKKGFRRGKQCAPVLVKMRHGLTTFRRCSLKSPAYSARSSSTLAASPMTEERMVNPMEIMPVLALAFMIACIPIVGDRP
jgi:hypothetical protein